MKKVLVFISVMILAIGCSNYESKRELLSSSEENHTAAMGDYDVNDEEQILEQAPMSTQSKSKTHNFKENDKVRSKIIKNGTMTLEVDSLDISKRNVDSILFTTNAYYESEVYNGGGNQHRYTLKIRIPNSEFEGFISSLENGGGEITNKSINARDVTSEYIDLEIRLKNNQAYLAQYRTLLKRANSIKEILEIEEKARRIELEIDSQLGRMKFIDDQVKYSTLTLHMYQKRIHKKKDKSPSFMTKVWESFKYGFNSFQEIILWIIVFWPFIVFIGLIFLGIRMFKKRKINTSNANMDLE